MIYLHFKWGGGYSKSEVDTLLNSKSDTSHTHTKSQITDFPSYGSTAGTICEGNDSRLSDARTPTSHTHVKSEITDFPSLATVATSGSYNDLSNKPTIPTVNNATLTIQKNGSDVATFTSNASSNVTANITVPTKTSDLTNDSGFLTSHQSLSNYVTINSKQTITATKTISANLAFSTTYTRGTTPSSEVFKDPIDYKDSAGNRICLFESAVYLDKSSLNGIFAYNTSVASGNSIGYIGIGSKADGSVFTYAPTPTASDNSNQIATTAWVTSGYVPRSGGLVMTGGVLGRTVNNSTFTIYGGTGWGNGSLIKLYGKDESSYDSTRAGAIQLRADKGSEAKEMVLYTDGTWTWTGQAVQLTSDKRLKQQISKIDNALLDAWEDVELSQFKYNDAVNEKGKDKARLHTGYVVQQIDEACQKHDVDISAYGLYCHEEYPERTEEVTIENEDGTTSKETKVIEEASEHYSLRYTETLVVECAYLRRENTRLKTRLNTLESRLEQLEQSFK